MADEATKAIVTPVANGTASTTIKEIEAYESKFEKWEKRGKAIIKRYRDERTEATNVRVQARKYNVLWSNVETLKPTLYARTPRIQVERRFKDADQIGRIACEIAERLGNYTVQTSGLDGVLRSCVHDRLLPGRAMAWVNYHADLSEVEQPFDSDDTLEAANEDGDDDAETDDTDDAGDGYATTEEKPEPELEKIRETIEPIYVDWRDFGYQAKRTWQEVNLAWRKIYLTREECVDRFGEDIGNTLPLDRRHGGDESKTDEVFDTATIYEAWNKKTRKVCWVNKSQSDYLDEIDPPVELQDFWPFPKPLFATMTNDTLIPIPDFVLYQDQAAELDKLTNRIGRLTDALKIAGVVDASVPELSRLLSPSGTPDNMLIQVANWQSLIAKGGIAGSFQLVPLGDIMAALQAAYVARDQVLNVIMQITGISDIMRGATDPGETATAQGIKSNYGSLRIKDTQAEVARFSRDIARIMVEIGVEMYEPKTIYEMVQAESFCEPTPQEQQRAAMMQKFGMPAPKPMQQFSQALQMLRDDKMRSFHIDIETDSTIALDEQQDKADVTEFIGAVGQFMQAFGPAITEMPALAPVAGEMLMFATRRFKAGRTLETTIEKAVAQIVQQAAQPKPPDPKIQGQLQIAQAKAQGAQAATQQKLQQSAQIHQQDLQANQIEKQQNLAEKAQEHQMSLMAQVNEQRIKQQAEASKHQPNLVVVR